MQSYQTNSDLSFTPFTPDDEKESVLLTPPELDEHKFGENRTTFRFDRNIPQFLFIPNLEESGISSHKYLKPRSEHKTALASLDMDWMNNKSILFSPIKSKSKVNGDLGYRKQTILKNSSKPSDIHAHSA